MLCLLAKWTALNNELPTTVSSKYGPVCLVVVYEQLDLWSFSLSNLMLHQAASKVKVCRVYLCLPDPFLTLTEVIGDVIRNVDLPISPLAPHAASAGAGVCISLCFAVDDDVSINQDWIILGED